MSFYRDFNDNVAIDAWNHEVRAPYQTLRLNRLTPTIGAEIEGVDLSQELSAAQLSEIRRALGENLALAFRDQHIDADDHKHFARQFGTLHRHALAASKTIAGAASDPEILGWKTGKESRFTTGDAWHSDVTCDPTPIFASVMRVLKTPEIGGGDTAFANMYLAYEALSDPLKLMLDGLTAVHDGAYGWTQGYGEKPVGTEFPSSEHPVVARHPVTGRKFLFVNSAFTTHIVQLTRPESDAVLGLLFRHIERSLVFQVRVHWTPSMLLVWDNWAAQHHAVWDYYPFDRWGERVSAYLDFGPQAAGHARELSGTAT